MSGDGNNKKMNKMEKWKSKDESGRKDKKMRRMKM